MDHVFPYYKVEENAQRSDWVVGRCSGPKHTLHTIMPSGFASYARICHPGWSVDFSYPDIEKYWLAERAGWIDPETLTPVRWHDVAVANNRNPHRLMQWNTSCLSTPRELGRSGIDSPMDGEFSKEMVESLFEILVDQSGENQEVLCGIWEGFNISDYRGVTAKFESYPGHQHYLLFNSTLSKVRDGWLAALEYAYRHHGIEASGYIPSALWPTTRDWYLAVPYNQQSSYLGGSADLVSRVFGVENLETYQALPGDNIFTDVTSKAFNRNPPSN